MEPSFDRTKRRPFHVRVVSEPPVPRCWSVNLSDTGIGLVGMPTPGEGPAENERLDLEFELPGLGSRVRAQGQVRWRHDMPGAVDGTSCALGVLFTGFEGDSRVWLTRYLESPPVRVAVAFADLATQRLLQAALGDTVQLEFGAENPEVEGTLARGDVSALVVCGDDEVQAMLLAELAAAVTDDNLTFEGKPRHLAARVIYCAPAEPHHMVRLFNEGKVFRRLEPPLHLEPLRLAVLEACNDLATRVEQERKAQELERNLLRERALRAGPIAPAFEAGPGFQSPKMASVLDAVRVAAPHRVAVLLQGETGTGKEVLARIVHRLSERRDGPFVVQDCGTLTETLLESELFGHVRGAFTGAVVDHPGLFVLADGGTVFLDEIENTSPGLQAKLLRVLETGEVRPVGSTQVRRVDVRLVTASNRALQHEVRDGRFRADLYYRLNTFTIELPPLRERHDDVLALARYFVDLFNHELRKGVMGLSTAAERALLAWSWPGNVRELRNAMERAVLLAKDQTLIGLEHLPPQLQRPAPVAREAGLRTRLLDAERTHINAALARHQGIIRRAARELDMDPVTLARRARKLGLM